MTFDLYVDTSRKGISMAIASPDGSAYEEIIEPSAKGESLSANLDTLLERSGATLDDVKRVMVTVGPGSFSGLRTGVAFCQGLCFSGKRNLYGVTTLQALECFAQAKEGDPVAVVIRARNGYWYLRLNGTEKFIDTAEVIQALGKNKATHVVADEAAQADNELKAVFEELGASISPDTGKPLSQWAPLFDTVKPTLIQEANYIQPSYFEKLKA
ncbi:tRNA (adenosine(37)-N6)-threonylcarbamoyltransferase complex dimerization subunit type 1 TsaB [uncultured Fibrobacter sp.]|uniref:tRNA (adenosine(37)-N6)-threonylcarbamoyltransferase complex dimerization subunit type 1 TsaB n=1 Tax=uncultured Fibrobacter sp. TaxID=261512 RepID=UPI002636CB2F|nr:tRNA (adenosine(37)-N6)-threonylcarbamoyltransferase complex dimerization subunit type 1 TsaB [uncultured Fibrobacter sp.]